MIWKAATNIITQFVFFNLIDLFIVQLKRDIIILSDINNGLGYNLYQISDNALNSFTISD